ncbi:hypothetical protein SAMN05443667_107192 [Flavobacterium gillisiae]|uniref:Carboxypeptidase regulatory-like domain-containing protein n=1 Tax=Flavobacterium gillisiae TaxID=150146 RepID=A0A1H4DFH6_9FLAO|nr:hypothetical protein [Flavobacterium gillisiae]SEA71032.1 hypothetical protein SAMN05443667_107192 [Flavobacterium gillisiae]
MKKLLLIILILIISACEIQYDGETKIILTGKLIDKTGKPISNKNIEIEVNGDGTYSSSDLISFGKSDKNGDFTFVFPSPKSDNTISISINNDGNEFQNKQILARKENFNNYKLDLNRITLYKNEDITSLRLITNSTSNNKQLTKILIEGLQPNNYINLNAINDASYFLETSFNVVKNQTVVIKYTITDYSSPVNVTTNDFVLNILIGNDPVIYTLAY